MLALRLHKTKELRLMEEYFVVCLADLLYRGYANPRPLDFGPYGKFLARPLHVSIAQSLSLHSVNVF